jgi:hypothetical protein
MKVRAYIPVPSYTRYVPEHTYVYASSERALRAGKILWERGARYLIVVEADIPDHYSKCFAEYGHAPCYRKSLRVVKVQAVR